MSTLTSSPSPAISPRTQFQPRARHHSYSSSPRASPRAYPSAASPKRAYDAPTSAPRQPRGHFVEHGPAVGGASVAYVDVGTQYSPDGLPPTAGRRNLAATSKAPEASPGLARKRKESTRAETPPSQQMSGANSGASSSSGGQQGLQIPSEPDPRRDPSAVVTPAQAAISNSQNAVEEPEPEEARTTHGHSSAPKRSRPESGNVNIMPRQYWTCNPKDLGVLISNMLMELIRLNDRIPLRDGKLTRFHSRAPPGISVSDYLQRLIQHATLSPPILLSTVYYIDRLCALYSAFTINSLTVHRFLITAATVAAKGLSDSFWTNPTYARIGGIPTTELATLELEFLQKVQWKIVPKPEVLEDYYRSLVDRTDGYELEPSSSSTSSIDESDEGLGSGDEQMDGEPT